MIQGQTIYYKQEVSLLAASLFTMSWALRPLRRRPFTRAVAGGAWNKPMPQAAAPQAPRGRGPGPSRQPGLGGSLPVPQGAAHLQALQRISVPGRQR